MRTPEEIEAIRAERAAKRAQPHLTAIYLGVEYPEGTKVWGWDWITKTPVVIGVIVSVNPDARNEVAVAKDASHRRWSNVPRGMRQLLGVSAFPSRALAIEWRRVDLLAERTRRVDDLARLDHEIASLATLPEVT